ncbi:MAG: NAD-dependent DNA ligase LigA, partial [Deltaproteobacteria bacterium]
MINIIDVNIARQRITQLRSEIEYHNKQYYLFDAPDIADSAYDKIMAELIYLENTFPEIDRTNSPTQKVGMKPTNTFSSSTHPSQMFSLANAFGQQDVIIFDERIRKLIKMEQKITFVVEPKIDGVAVNLTYIDGKLISGATRGDGTIGED